MLSSGDLLDGRYRLIVPLASGGMGTVWRAHHTALDVHVALKLMHPTDEPTGRRRARFRREARLVAQLQSQHVVRVLDHGVVGELAYLAMELLEGESLDVRLSRGGPLDLAHAARVLDGVACGLQLAHDRGILHRDLKPANIFLATVDGLEVPKVLDFGIAKAVGGEGAAMTATRAGELVGSPAYMSPEQVWGDELTGATDLWSLGVVALEAVTGVNPFDGGPLARVFERIIRDDLPRPRDLRADLPLGLDTFFERALRRDAARRFESPLALARAFREAIHAPATTTAASTADPPVRDEVATAATVDAAAASTTVDAAGASDAAPLGARHARTAPAGRTRPGQWARPLALLTAGALVAGVVVTAQQPTEDLPPHEVEATETSTPRALPASTTPMAAPARGAPPGPSALPSTSAPASLSGAAATSSGLAPFAGARIPRGEATATPSSTPRHEVADRSASAPAGTPPAVDPLFGITRQR